MLLMKQQRRQQKPHRIIKLTKLKDKSVKEFLVKCYFFSSSLTVLLLNENILYFDEIINFILIYKINILIHASV